jgi:hypothetical protein
MTAMDITMRSTCFPQDDPIFYRETSGFEVHFHLGYGGMCWLEGA